MPSNASRRYSQDPVEDSAISGSSFESTASSTSKVTNTETGQNVMSLFYELAHANQFLAELPLASILLFIMFTLSGHGDESPITEYLSNYTWASPLHVSSQSGYFVLYGLIVIFLSVVSFGLAANYYVIHKGLVHQMRGLGALAFGLQALRYVLIFPFLSLFIGTLKCDFNNLDSQCWDTGGMILNLSVIVLMLWTFVLYLIPSSSFHIVSPFTNVMAQVHGRLQIVLSVWVWIHTCCHQATISSSYLAIVSGVLGVGYALLVIALIRMVPYYFLAANLSMAFVLGNLMTGNIMFTILYYANGGEESGASTWGVLGTSLGGGTVTAVALLIRLIVLQYKRQPESSWDMEVKLRTMGFRMNGARSKNRNNSVLGDDVLMSDEVSRAYEDALQQFPRSAILRLSFVTYLMGLGVDEKLVILKLKDVRKVKLKVDLEYIKFCRMRQFAPREEVDMVDMSKMLRRAQMHCTRVKNLEQALWRLVLKKRLSFKLLSMLLRQMNTEETRAESLYGRLRSRFPNNANILRAQALFMEDVKHDANTAMALYAQADELEEEQSRHHHKATISQRGGISGGGGGGMPVMGGQEEANMLGDADNSSETATETTYQQRVGKGWRGSTLSLKASTVFLLLMVTAALLTAFGVLLGVVDNYRQTTEEFVDGALVEIGSQLQVTRSLALQIHTINNKEREINTTESKLESEAEVFQERAKRLARYALSKDNLADTWLQDTDVRLRFWRKEQNKYESRNYTLWKSADLLGGATEELMEYPVWQFATPNITNTYSWRFIMDNSYQSIGPQMGDMVHTSTEYFNNFLKERLMQQPLILTCTLLSVLVLFTLLIVYVGARVVYRLKKSITVFESIPKKLVTGVLRDTGYQNNTLDHDEVMNSLSGMRIEFYLLLSLGIFLFGAVLLLCLIFGFQLIIYNRLGSHAESITLVGNVEYYLSRSLALSLQDVIGYEHTLTNNLTRETSKQLNLLEQNYRELQFGTSSWEGSFGKDSLQRLFFGNESCSLTPEDLGQSADDYRKFSLCLGMDNLIDSYVKRYEQVRDIRQTGQSYPLNATTLSVLINTQDAFRPLTLELLSSLRDLRNNEIDPIVAGSVVVTFLGIPTLALLMVLMIFPAIRRLQDDGIRVMNLLLMLPAKEISHLPEVRSYLLSGKVGNKNKDDRKQSTKSILQAAADGVVMFDDSGVVTEINAAAEKLFETKMESILGKKIGYLLREGNDGDDEDPKDEEGTPTKKNKRGKGSVISEIFSMRRGTSLSLEATIKRMNDASFPAHVSVSCGSMKNKRYFAMFVRDLSEQKLRQQLFKEEKEKSEKLLLNILPRHIAKRLQAGEKEISDSYESCTILFMDMVSFTSYSSSVGAKELVSVLNNVFSRCDEIMKSYGVEKIKTIGDAYMAVCGLEYRVDHAEATVCAGLEFLREMERKTNDHSIPPIQFRVGINSGQVVGGIIGKEKFQFDVWGDDVNMASRMESNGVPGKIQVSRKTYELVYNKFHFEERTIHVKGKGETQVYLCLGSKQHSTPNRSGSSSNSLSSRNQTQHNNNNNNNNDNNKNTTHNIRSKGENNDPTGTDDSEDNNDDEYSDTQNRNLSSQDPIYSPREDEEM